MNDFRKGVYEIMQAFHRMIALCLAALLLLLEQRVHSIFRFLTMKEILSSFFPLLLADILS